MVAAGLVYLFILLTSDYEWTVGGKSCAGESVPSFVYREKSGLCVEKL
jgi:hypothetical protein